MQLFSREEIEGMDADKLTVLYFLKVIQLFEQSGHYDYVIELAKTAIDICNPEDENRDALQCSRNNSVLCTTVSWFSLRYTSNVG